MKKEFLLDVVWRDARLGGKFVFLTGKRSEHDFDQISAMAAWRGFDFSRRAAAAGLNLQFAAGPLALAEVALLGVGGPEANAFGRLIDFDGDFRRVLVVFFEVPLHARQLLLVGDHLEKSGERLRGFFCAA